MRGTAQQYPMMPSAHGFPVVVPPGAVPRQPVMHFAPSSAGLPANMHPQYAMYGMPMVRKCWRFDMMVMSCLLC